MLRVQECGGHFGKVRRRLAGKERTLLVVRIRLVHVKRDSIRSQRATTSCPDGSHTALEATSLQDATGGTLPTTVTNGPRAPLLAGVTANGYVGPLKSPVALKQAEHSCENPLLQSDCSPERTRVHSRGLATHRATDRIWAIILEDSLQRPKASAPSYPSTPAPPSAQETSWTSGPLRSRPAAKFLSSASV